MFSLFLLLSLTPALAALPTETEILATRTQDCRDFLEKLPPDTFHGWVESAEDIHNPDSRKILVFYWGLKAPGFANPVNFHNGGPGYPNHSIQRFRKILDEQNLREKISLIYVDQRGNGCSDQYPQGDDRETVLRLRWYGSSGIVHDSEVVRKALLGERKWKVFGQSYGAFIVHRYAILFPDSLEGAYAHANAISLDPLERLTQRIYSQHRVLQTYFQKFPEDRAKLQKLHDLAEKADFCLKLKDGSDSCGFTNTEFVLSDLGFTSDWHYLHENLTRLVTEKGEVNMKEWPIVVDEYASFDGPSSMTSTAGSVISEFDRNIPGSNEETCSLVMRNIEKMGVTEREQLANECQSAIQFHYVPGNRKELRELLGGQNDHMTWELLRSGLTRLGAGKFHLYSGENDTYVPKETIQPEAEAMKDLVEYTHFQNSGHDGFFTEMKVWEDLAN